jgi:hypothetical protein
LWKLGCQDDARLFPAQRVMVAGDMERLEKEQPAVAPPLAEVRRMLEERARGTPAVAASRAGARAASPAPER